MKIEISGYINADIAGLIVTASLKKLGFSTTEKLTVYVDPGNNKLPPVVKVDANKFMEDMGNPSRYSK